MLAPVPVPFLWTLDFGFGSLIWDLDLGLGFGTWIWDSDLGLDLGLTIKCLGNMIRPRTWMNPEGTDGNHVGCGILKDLPTNTEYEHHSGREPDCMDLW